NCALRSFPTRRSSDLALGVVADQDLRERRVELQDVLAEAVAVLEVELVLARLLHGHGERQALPLGAPRDVGAELLVHQEPGLLRSEEHTSELQSLAYP